MMSDKLSVEAIEMLADDYERGMIGPRRLRQYFDYLIQQLAAAKAELAAAVKKVEDFDLVVVMNKKICSELDAAKARVAAYKKALDIAMSTNQSHETYCKVEAALEEKP